MNEPTIGDQMMEFMADSICSDLGYGLLLEHCTHHLGCDNFDLKASLPIGYDRITNRFSGTIYLSDEVHCFTEQVIKPCTNQGVEVPYLFLGNYQKLGDEIIIYIEKVVKFKEEKERKRDLAVIPESGLLEAKKDLSSGRYNVSIIGHSHPYLTNNQEELSKEYLQLLEYLRTVKQEQDFRNGNLNMTYKDLCSYIEFIIEMKRSNPHVITMQSIYHDNGELNFLYANEEFYLFLATNVFYKTENGVLESVNNIDNNTQIQFMI